MWLRIDPAALGRIGPYVSDRTHGDTRRYYPLRLEDDRLALVVCRNDLRLPALAGRVVDAALGWDSGTPGFVLYVGQRHTKVTIHRVLTQQARHDATLSEVLDNAPIRRNPNV